MKKLRRMCVNCLEDFAEDDCQIGLCLACGYEHDRSIELQKIKFGKRNETSEGWWGPTIEDIDREELSSGFYIAHTNDLDDAPLRDEYMVEQWNNLA